MLIQELLEDDVAPAKPVRSTRNRRQPKAKGQRRVDEALLVKVADAYNNAEPRGRGAAVSEVVGCPPSGSSYYVTRARKAGLLA